jgi:hypothetical protein
MVMTAVRVGIASVAGLGVSLAASSIKPRPVVAEEVRADLASGKLLGRKNNECWRLDRSRAADERHRGVVSIGDGAVWQ